MKKLNDMPSNVFCKDKVFYALLHSLREPSSGAIDTKEDWSFVSMEKYCMENLNDKDMLLDIISKCSDLRIPTAFSPSLRKRFILLALNSALSLNCLEQAISLLKQNLLDQHAELYGVVVIFICNLVATNPKKHGDLLRLLDNVGSLSDKKLVAFYVLAKLSLEAMVEFPTAITKQLDHQLEMVGRLSSQTAIHKKHRDGHVHQSKNEKKKLRRKRRHLQKLSQKNGGTVPSKQANPPSQWVPKQTKKNNRKKNSRKPNTNK